MYLAKASDKDLDTAQNIMLILGMISDGEYPSTNDNAPDFFDEDNQQHLRFLYDRLMYELNASPGCLFRVIGGFVTAMQNNVFDPNKDILTLHPRLFQKEEA